MGFLSSFLDRSGGGTGDGEDDEAVAFFNPSMGSGRDAGRLLAPGMTSCGLPAGCGVGAGAFFSGGGEGLGSLWIGCGGGLGSLWLGGGGGGLRSLYRASRACASASFISAESSCGGGHDQDHNYQSSASSQKGGEGEEAGAGARTRDW